jgi:hypothetical protein
MRLTEVVQVAPRFFLAVLVAALFGPSVWYLALLLGLTFWPQTARLLRARCCRCASVSTWCMRGWTLTRSHSHSPCPAECSVGWRDHRRTSGGRGDPGRSEPGLPGPGRPHADQLGLHAEQRAAVSPHGVVDVGVSGAALALTVLGTNLFADGVQAALDPRLANQ